MSVAVLRAVAVSAEVETSRLVALPWSGGDLGLVTQAARHESRWLSPAVTAFLAVAREVSAPSEINHMSGHRTPVYLGLAMERAAWPA